jgi:hypothetical protein
MYYGAVIEAKKEIPVYFEQIMKFLRHNVVQILLWLAILSAIAYCNGGDGSAGQISRGSHALSLPTQNLPISFESNVGQVGSETKFIAHAPGYNLSLTARKTAISFRTASAAGGADCRPASTTCLHASRAVLGIRLIGANTKARPEGRKPLLSYSNYLIGNDPHKWHTHVPQYAEVWYPDVYPGIDLAYYGESGQLEYDFIVAPHANAHLISFTIDGLRNGRMLTENASGDLVIPVGEKQVLLHKPRLYQGNSCMHVHSGMDGAACKALSGGGFRLRQDASGTHVAFELPTYNHDQALVVDPVVSFSTFLGGSGGDGANGMALDSAGNIYLIGGTNSTDFPVTSGAFQSTLAGNTDAFVAKLSSDGQHLIYATYLGGSNAEFPTGIAVDSSGNTYLTGQTYSTDFPLASPYQSQNLGAADAFVSKLSPDGSVLIFSTYLGGTSQSEATSIAVDSSGEAAVTGWTYATDFPVVNAFQSEHAPDGGTYDAFVTKFSADGLSLVFSTYLGGNSADLAQAVAIDAAGSVYVAGMTNSSNFPTTPEAYQTTYVPGSILGDNGFVTKFDATGETLSYSTYLSACQIFGISVNASGNAFVTGTAEGQFPVTPGAFQTIQGSSSSSDAFVTQFDSTGSSLVYSTYLGGSNYDYGYAIALDSSSNAYVTGTTYSTNFPLKFPVQSTFYAGVPDAFVSEVSSAGSQLLFSTYLGGGSDGYGDSQGNAIAVDSSANIYVSGSTTAPDFPVTKAIQPTLKGTGDAFITKYLNVALITPAVTVTPSSSSITTLQALDVTVTISGGSGNPTPTGTVKLTSGSYTSPATTLSGGSATINIPAGSLAIGTDTLTATYSGDSNYNAATGSGSVTVTAPPPSFTVTTTAVSVSPGATTGNTSTITLTPSGGFTGSVTLTAAVTSSPTSATDPPTLSFGATSPVSITGANAVTATLTITTTAPTSAALAYPAHPGIRWYAASTTLAFGLIFGMGIGLPVRRRWRTRLGLLIFLVTLVVGFMACGGGSSTSTSNPGTTAGTYTITVTGTSGSTTATSTVTLTVQ